MKTCVFCLAFFWGCALAGFAQVRFEPEMLIFSLDRGQTKNVDVVIHNDAREPREIQVEINYRRGETSAGNVSSWCQVQPKKLQLAAGGSREVHLAFAGPAGPPGECVLSLFAGESLQTPIPLNVRVGMPVFIRLNGEKRAQGEILSVVPKILPGNQMAVRVLVKNQGALHLTPFGLAWVEDAGHQRVWQADIRCDQPVFPGEVLSLEARSAASAWQGVGELQVQMFWGTLYGNEAVGAPLSSVKRLPLPVGSMN